MGLETALLIGSLAASVGSSFIGGKAPKASTAAATETGDAARKAKKSRSALFETAGGVAGEEVMSGDVQTRTGTLLGN